MKKLEMLYEGKAKKIYATDEADAVIMEFKDDLTAFNNKKKGSEEGKGALNCKITTEIFKLLETNGIKTHYVSTMDDNHIVAKKVDIIPIEVVVRNVATGSLTKRLGITEGTKLPFALVEFYYKSDELDDPLINDQHALIMNLINHESELEELRRAGREINMILKSFFEKKGLNLIDFKIEFGKNSKGEILLADEITPDSCRFWDAVNNEKLDKDRFRQGLGNVKVAYQEVLNRIMN